MNKKIIIKTIEEWGELVGIFGQFQEKDILDLVNIATKENMRCLSYIDIPRDTYFNFPQCQIIEEELNILKKYKELNCSLLDAIEKAIEAGRENESFIKFESSEE